jgi:hypothetical protein
MSVPNSAALDKGEAHFDGQELILSPKRYDTPGTNFSGPAQE